MVTLSVSIPEELKQQILELDEVNWSAVARNAFEEKIKQMKLLKSIANKSKLTAKDAEEISKQINESMSKKFRAMK